MIDGVVDNGLDRWQMSSSKENKLYISSSNYPQERMHFVYGKIIEITRRQRSLVGHGNMV